MTKASVEVDVCNPAQVFAALGLQEIAGALAGDVTSRFVSDEDGAFRFELRWGDAAGLPWPRQEASASEASVRWVRAPERPAEDPLALALAFLRHCRMERWADGEVHPNPEKDEKKWPVWLLASCRAESARPSLLRWQDAPEAEASAGPFKEVALPLSCWSDASSRGDFKLFAGTQAGSDICAYLLGDEARPSEGVKGLLKRWSEENSTGEQDAGRRAMDRADPEGRGHADYADLFDRLMPCKSSFRLDPRGSWTSMGAGYSINKVDVTTTSNPLVELLAVMGLENARPSRVEGRRYRYAVWTRWSSLPLARMLLASPAHMPDLVRASFEMEVNGKYKNVTFGSLL